jgi:hypothetical protein
MLTWLYGTRQVDTAYGVDDACIEIDPSFVKSVLECGIRVSQPDAQSIIMIAEDELKSAFCVRVCPVWDLHTKSIVDYVLQTKQMYHPHARDAGVFVSWLKRYGLKCNFMPDKMDISSSPITLNGMSTVHTWIVTPRKLKYEFINCWVLHHTSEVITLDPSVDQQCDKKEKI